MLLETIGGLSIIISLTFLVVMLGPLDIIDDSVTSPNRLPFSITGNCEILLFISNFTASSTRVSFVTLIIFFVNISLAFNSSFLESEFRALSIFLT